MTDYTELKERLRAKRHNGQFTLGGASVGSDGSFQSWGGERILVACNPDGNQAADAITALEARVAELEGALRPFADCCDQIDAGEDDEEWAKFRLLIKDYRRARTALGVQHD